MSTDWEGRPDERSFARVERVRVTLGRIVTTMRLECPTLAEWSAKRISAQAGLGTTAVLSEGASDEYKNELFREVVDSPNAMLWWPG